MRLRDGSEWCRISVSLVDQRNDAVNTTSDTSVVHLIFILFIIYKTSHLLRTTVSPSTSLPLHPSRRVKPLQKTVTKPPTSQAKRILMI